jgi:hypothetical protein
LHTLDRLGRTVPDTLNMIHALTGRGVGVRNLADPIRVDSPPEIVDVLFAAACHQGGLIHGLGETF